MDIEHQYIKNVDTLIPRPDIALEVLKLAHDADCSIPELASKVELDPSLTANMLRMANSALFGHMRKITSVTDIIVRLGLESVKLMAISSASIGVLRSPQAAYGLDPGHLWDHSYATALLASIIGSHAKVSHPSMLFTAGLLHDIGKIVLNRALESAKRHHGDDEIPAEMNPEAELKLLHTNHARVGMALLKKWGLPDKITIPVGFHHDRGSEQAGWLNCRIVYLANWLAGQITISEQTEETVARVLASYHANREVLPEVPAFDENGETVIEEFLSRFDQKSGTLFL